MERIKESEKQAKAENIVALFQKGFFAEQIIKQVGVSESFYWETIRKNGLGERATRNLDSRELLRIEDLEDYEITHGTYINPKAHKVEINGKKYLDITEFLI